MAKSTAKQKLPFKPRIKAAERRALIEEAAARLIAERGYDAASLEEIAQAAGVSKAVLYDHYSSKAELQLSLLRQNTEALMGFTAKRVAAAEGGPEARFRAGVEAFFEFVETHVFAWRMIFRDPSSDPVVAEASREMHAYVTGGIAAMFRTEPNTVELVSEGDPDRVEMMAQQIKMALAGLASWWYDHRARSREEMVSAVMNLFWVGMERLAEGESWEPDDSPAA